METDIKDTADHAKTIANQVVSIMGDGFFTIAEMRKKVASPEAKYSKKLSWGEAQEYIDYLSTYGFCEVLKPNSTPTTLQYRIRIDVEFRRLLYEATKQQLQNRIKEIDIVLSEL